jgi:hypothetical protein
MRVCECCDNRVGLNKREEPSSLSLHGLCPKCQKTPGSLQLVRKRAYDRRIAREMKTS